MIDDVRTFPFPALYARDSRSGVAALIASVERGVWIDELWLDHDLGGDDTIVPVVDWLCERCTWEAGPAIGRVVVHTANPVGAAMIERTLRRWYDVVRIDAATAGAVVEHDHMHDE